MTASIMNGKIAATVVGLTGVMLALTGCGGQSVDGEYYIHSNNDSAQAVISGSTMELYMIECVDGVAMVADESSMTGEINSDRTELTATSNGDEVSVPFHVSDGILTVGGEVYTQMSESEGLASSQVCS